MPSLNFEGRFSHAVSSGLKLQTIRPPRNTPIRFGDTVHLFSGLRTAAVCRLGAGKVLRVEPVIISPDRVQLSGIWLTEDETERLAWDDGFGGWPEMRAWFLRRYTLPFKGDLIVWDLLDNQSDFLDALV
ncbi:MAG: hypothetical protein AAF191_11980 [Verrucomicrobiota bacterium]